MYDQYDNYGDDGYDGYGHGSGYRESDHGYDNEEDEYRRGYKAAIPDYVKTFLTEFSKAIADRDVIVIQDLTENKDYSWSRLSEQYFKSSPWPRADEIASYVNKDATFLVLYKELYYRDLYARFANDLQINHRFESYMNYCTLFNYILNADRPVALQLPNQWLWEIIDEFIYQFQSFSQFRANWSKKSDLEIDMLRDNPKMWNVHGVLNVLHSLVDKSNINRQLEVYATGGDPDSVAGEFGRHPLYKMLGYFSLVGLLRLHSLLGDYHQAIKVLENIELNRKSLYSRVPACQISTYYYVGFAYMMMRRYADAIRTFSNILLYIQRTKLGTQHRHVQYDETSKKTDQMYSLLSICLVLYPQSIDDSLMGIIREKHGESMVRMQRGNMEEFQTTFQFACPKFISPVPPTYDSMSPDFESSKEHLNSQMRVFMEEVQQQVLIPTVRNYMKLYATMSLSKLAGFMEMNEDDFRNQLLCFKHKQKNVVWMKGASGLDGELQTGSDVDFFIDKEMIHIADTKVSRRYGDFFIRQIHKLEEMTRTLKKLDT